MRGEKLCISLTAMMECKADPPHTTHPFTCTRNACLISFPLSLAFSLCPPLHDPSICSDIADFFSCLPLFNQLPSFLTLKCNGSFCFCHRAKSRQADRMNFKDCITNLTPFSAIIMNFMVTSPTQSRKFPFTSSFHTTSWQHLIFLQDAFYFVYIVHFVVL